MTMEFHCSPGVDVRDFAEHAVAMRRRVAEDFVAVHNDRRVPVAYSTSVDSFLATWDSLAPQAVPVRMVRPGDAFPSAAWANQITKALNEIHAAVTKGEPA